MIFLTKPIFCGVGGVINEKATIANIESYVELLYEDMAEKVRGSGLILELAKDPNNLEDLSKNGKEITLTVFLG